jgi:hypothetical protein
MLLCRCGCVLCIRMPAICKRRRWQTSRCGFFGTEGIVLLLSVVVCLAAGVWTQVVGQQVCSVG